jgi:hypothetical protein
MSLTIAPSPFGSLVVSVAETGSTLSVTTVATSPSVLTMALGVPGPAGATGSQGPAGTNGTNGVGVAAGGTTGQALVKLSGTNYDTGWASINSAAWGNITGTLSSQTDLYNALNDKLSTSAAASTYQTQAGMSAFLSTASAVANYQTISGMSAYLSTSAAASTYLPFTGGTMSGTIFLSSLRNLLNTDLTVTAYNDTGAGTNFVHTFDAFDGTFTLATNGGGLKFPDLTVQVTAGLPLTGGTVGGTVTIEGNLTVNQLNINDGDISYIGSIQFSDSSVQTTAFIPANYLSTSAAYSTFLPLTGGTMSSTGINGIVDANTWSFGYNGLSGYNDVSSTLFNFNANSIYATSNNGYDTFTLNPSGVSGTVGDDPAQSWSFGISGLTFSDSTVQTTAGLPLTGGTITGNTFVNNIHLLPDGFSDPGGDSYNNSVIRVFSDNGHFGLSGDGITLDINNVADPLDRVFLVGAYDKTLSLADNANGTQITMSPNNGITFSDSSVQTTAGIPEAPIDGNAYVRKDGAWVNINDL